MTKRLAKLIGIALLTAPLSVGCVGDTPGGGGGPDAGGGGGVDGGGGGGTDGGGNPAALAVTGRVLDYFVTNTPVANTTLRQLAAPGPCRYTATSAGGLAWCIAAVAMSARPSWLKSAATRGVRITSNTILDAAVLPELGASATMPPKMGPMIRTMLVGQQAGLAHGCRRRSPWLSRGLR